MKMLRILFPVLLVLLVGCISQKLNKGYVDSVPDEIQHLIAKKYSGSLSAVGTASGSEELIAVNKAVLQARVEIARQFKSEIEVLQKDYEEQVGESASAEYNEVMNAFSMVELNGSQIAKTMIRKDKFKTYSAKVLVVVTAEQLKNIIDNKMQDYTSYKATNAYKELESRVEKEKKLQNE